MLDLSKIERPKNLPQWECPPLDEVAIAIQFNDIAGLKSLHYGLLAEHLHRFGLTQYKDNAPLAPSFEVFGKRVTPAEFQIQFQAAGVPLPRVWFISDDSHKLVQLQPDKFVYNWRKVEGIGEYPRFDKVVLPEFLERYRAFEAFLAKQGLAPVIINQCELSYFNIVEIDEDETYSEAFARIFRFWASHRRVESLNDGASLERDGGNVTLTHILKAPDGTPLARIHANIAAAERRSRPVIRFSLIFRGPWTATVDAPLIEFLAKGREAIVRLFDSMISDQMHAAWGRSLPVPGS